MVKDELDTFCGSFADRASPTNEVVDCYLIPSIDLPLRYVEVIDYLVLQTCYDFVVL